MIINNKLMGGRRKWNKLKLNNKMIIKNIINDKGKN